MSKKTLLTTVAGVVFGGVLFNSWPAFADLPVTDPVMYTMISRLATTITNDLTNEINSITSSLTNNLTNMGNPTSVSSLLTNGFTQLSNYAKAQVGAQEQIADASNTAMAQYEMQTNNAQIRDEQTLSPLQCTTVDNGQAVAAASLQGWRTEQSIEAVTDPRGEAQQGNPGWYGAGQALAAANQVHLARYCDPDEAAAALCSQSPMPNADQRASSLFGYDNLGNTAGVDAANDFATNLLQPIVPAAIRGDQLTSVSGQDYAAHRRAYNARMSLSRMVLSYAIGLQAPGITLTSEQQQQLQAEGITVPQSGSWLQSIALEAGRRMNDVSWAAGLQQMAPPSVLREIATELALANYLQFQNFRVQLMNATLSAAQLAVSEERGFQTTTEMPTPTISN